MVSRFRSWLPPKPRKDEPISAFSEDDLRRRGFTGFIAFADLDLSAVPREPGVYAVLRGSSREHTVLDTSVGGWFKGKDPTDDPAKLMDRLCESQTLYIDKADAGSGGNRGLWKRTDELAKYGQGLPVAHQGGRYIWQLSDSPSLRTAWLPKLQAYPDLFEHPTKRKNHV